MSVDSVAVLGVELEDRPGALEEFLATDNERAYMQDIVAFASGGGKGATFCIPADMEGLKAYADSIPLASREYAGFIISEDRTELGAWAGATKPLADAGVNMVLCAALVLEGSYKMLVVVEQADAQAAVRALGAQGL